ncbi:uncharacterized protein LOC129891650 isoform X2 [Solanum dulcamara]|uniref:uncharacterized protein LOC129891650 isoform X2 n=1 Tax=Solanum dulcamara TaxID=45834 RepID=UPI00248652EE|nr:uncharacterized protein LOC129891650 isoform X2 [Solanum dulcamara]
MLLTGRFMLRSLSVASSPSTPTLQEIASNHPAGIAKVVLKKGKTQLFKDGSPMVYSGAVDRVIGRPPPTTGDIVLVADGTEKPIGWGFYNSTSMFRVRLMQQEEETAQDPSSALNPEKLLETRIAAAAMLRQNLGLPSAHTNAYRLVNSEGDRLSGLIVDIFGDLAVIASSAAWVQMYQHQIMDCLSRLNIIKRISWRPTIEILKEEGLDLSDLKKPDLIIPQTRVKTGFYADQRENRCFLSTISEGRRVLDICCYTGGFALSAASGGALDVIGVDTSLPALQLAKENVALNGLDPRRISFLRQDATEFMKAAVSRNESWDIIILDPPKLAPRKKVLKSASGMYRNLNYLAMQLTKRGGLLMTCSCSGAMTQSGMFFRILQGAASMAGRKITVVREAGAACDHPIDPAYLEGAYLTNILLRVL